MLSAKIKVSLGIVAVAAAGWLGASDAWAHRGGGPSDPCERRLGPLVVHITLYQPEFDPDAEYCNAVPRAGKTVLVVDIAGDQARRTALGLEVTASDDSRKVLSVAPKVYRQGVADAVVELSADHSYIVRVNLEDGGEKASRALTFPILVGAWYTVLIAPAIMISVLLVLVVISIVRYYRSPQEAPALKLVSASSTQAAEAR